MRNTTKLKAILLKYVVSIDMDENEFFTLTLIDKHSGNTAEIQAKSYSFAISKAYSYLLHQLKREEKGLDEF